MKVKDGLDSRSSVLLAMGYDNDEAQTVTSSTRHVIVEYLVTSSSDVSGGLMASYVTLGTIHSSASDSLITLVMKLIVNVYDDGINDKVIACVQPVHMINAEQHKAAVNKGCQTFRTLLTFS